MSRKPVIGLNTDFRKLTKDAPAFSYLASDYYDAVLRAGGLPLLIPPLTELDDVEQVIEMLDGVVMIGGADLDPRRDGFMIHPSVMPQAPRREEFDRKLIQQIAERRIPVLGIGAGMQLLNVSQGGNLYLHIPEDVPTALPHADPIDREHRHTLVIERDSIMEKVFGDGEIRVNSMHHMAVDEVAPGFRVTARCPDGIIECIESEMPDWFAVGTQFHPESSSASALDHRIFEEFMEGVHASEPAVKLVA